MPTRPKTPKVTRISRTAVKVTMPAEERKPTGNRGLLARNGSRHARGNVGAPQKHPGS